MALWVKDVALLQLWLGFNPWPRDLPYAVHVAVKKKKKKFPLWLSRLRT